MKIQQIFEAISLSSKKHAIQNTIYKSITYTSNKCLRLVQNDIYYFKNTREIWFFTVNFFDNEFEDHMITHLNNLLQKAPYYVAYVRFQELPKGVEGECRFNTLLLNTTTIEALKNTIIDSMIIDDPIFNDEGDVNMDALTQMFRSFRRNKTIRELTSYITNTIVHELVHVEQHKTQTHRFITQGKLEYRSYLANTQRIFDEAISNLQDPKNADIYFASPQEIDAFAHGTVVELIDIATNSKPIVEFNTEELLNSLITKMQQTLQDTSNLSRSAIYQSNYKQFNTPQNRKRYKVFKRFMKRVYSEIQRYITYLQNNLIQIQKGAKK